MPASIHNVWTMVAVGILAVFAIKGLCDYAANYLVNYVGLSAVTDLRQTVFDRVVHQDAHFFEANSTARVMSSIMNDLEKIQVAMSHILADLLRQSFTALGLAAVVLQTDWKLALVSLTVLPFVLVPTLRLGRRIRRTTRSAQDNAAELNQVLQETLSGHQVVKSFGAEEIESNRFRDRAERLRSSNLRYVAQQAIASPLIEFFGAITIVGLLTYARAPDQSRLHDHRRVHQLRDRAADAVRAGEAADRHPQHLSAGAGRVAESVRVSGSRPAGQGEAGCGPAGSLRKSHRVREREFPLPDIAGRLGAGSGSIWR